MPEGPSILILKEKLSEFKGKKIISVTGDAKIDLDRLFNQKIKEFKSWGKHFLICFDDFFIRIHLLMFGSYTINEHKDRKLRLGLKFKAGEINFYTCSVTLTEGNVNDVYDWETDVLSDKWNPAKAKKKIKKSENLNICDALLDQEIFSGVGNIIKNEVLFRTKVHPLSEINNLPLKKLNEIIKEAVNYSWDFYNWKKKNELNKHLVIYEKKECPRCHIPSEKEYIGKSKRLTCYCNNCQKLFENKV